MILLIFIVSENCRHRSQGQSVVQNGLDTVAGERPLASLSDHSSILEEVQILASPSSFTLDGSPSSSPQRTCTPGSFVLGAYAPRRNLVDFQPFTTFPSNFSSIPYHSVSDGLLDPVSISSIRSAWDLSDDVQIAPVSSRSQSLVRQSGVSASPIIHDVATHADIDSGDVGFVTAIDEPSVAVSYRPIVDDVFLRTEGRRSRKVRGGAVIVEYSPEKDTVLRNFVRGTQRK